MARTTNARPTRPHHTTTTLTPEEQATVREIMREMGINRARLRLGVARHAMERAAGGLSVQRGTATLIRLAIGASVQVGPQQSTEVR